MQTINEVFDKFLVDQSARLTKTTFNRYRVVMELFEDYLNGYAYQCLEKEDATLFESKHGDGIEFCEIFGPEKIPGIDEFLGYFMIRKVAGSKELMKNTGTVMRKLITWLKNHSYIENQDFKLFMETVNELKDDLPKVVEFKEALSAVTNKNYSEQFESYQEGYFSITKVESGKLWLEDYIDSDLNIGPVIVSIQISSLAKVGWVINLELGRRDRKWYIIENGSVYPN